jgi:hypothetical protein|tara:strand:+ start:213 stop:419 length:207 start_codon:yes stop_codon:yes gene_type:complete
MFILALMPVLFFASNGEFFERVEKETSEGAVWHHVGKQPLDPDAKQIDVDGHIYWKLKKPKETTDGRK